MSVSPKWLITFFAILLPLLSSATGTPVPSLQPSTAISNPSPSHHACGLVDTCSLEVAEEDRQDKKIDFHPPVQTHDWMVASISFENTTLCISRMPLASLHSPEVPGLRLASARAPPA